MDWILSILTIIGIWLIGKKILWGWLFSAFASILWVVYALKLSPPQYGLIPASVIYFIIDIISFIRWYKDEHSNLQSTASYTPD